MPRLHLVLPLLPFLTACATGAGGAFGVGRTTTGSLMPDDPRFADGSHYRPFPFTGRAGDTITAELESADFDANLILTDAHGNRIEANDDGGANCNSRLTSVLRHDGPYRIYVNSSATAELGAFRLALRRGGSVAPTDTSCYGFGRVQGMIQVGETVEGTLTTDDPVFASDSSHFQRWVIPVTPGQAFTVDLTSVDFDAYLLLTYGGGDKVSENDDGGGGCNARIVHVPAGDRPLRVIVNSSGKHETGRYVLRVSAGRSTVDTQGQCFTG